MNKRTIIAELLSVANELDTQNYTAFADKLTRIALTFTEDDIDAGAGEFDNLDSGSNPGEGLDEGYYPGGDDPEIIIDDTEEFDPDEHLDRQTEERLENSQF